MENGTRVCFKPSVTAPEEVRKKLASLDTVVGVVAAKDTKKEGVYTVLLPEGVTVVNYSRACGCGRLHYVDVHETHLKPSIF